MESTLAAVDLGRYRRIIQMLWDPEPTNDGLSNAPVWCLGQRYRIVTGCEGSGCDPKKAGVPATETSSIPSVAVVSKDNAPQARSYEHQGPSNDQKEALQLTAKAENYHSVAKGQDGRPGNWPSAFLDDMESRIWMTYRSDFPPIPKSNDPRAASALSLSMRVKSQLVDQNGFTSDTGWGCMIRSGQSLLANTMVFQSLGRGERTISSLSTTRSLTVS
jgi:cysteine protease ATG4